MSVDISVPSVGESITEGTIARWLKKDGERVEQNEPLYELETDKATTEVPAPSAGILHIAVHEGQTVAVGAKIGTLETGPIGDGKKEMPKNETPKATPPKAEKRMEQPAPAVREPQPVNQPPKREPSAKAPEEPKVAKPPVTEKRPEPQAPSSPPRREQPAEAPKAARGDQDEWREPMSPIRQRIAQRLLSSQQSTATLTTFNEADLAGLQNLRARYQQRFQEMHGVKLGLMSFFVKACVRAMEAFPIVNAFVDQGDIVYHRHCHIGVAVNTEKGLFVPVLRHAENMSFAQIEKTIAELAEKARHGAITIHDLQDGTFTITNGGVFGSLLSTPILNPPQSAILGTHTIQKRPVVIDDEIVIRPMMYLALSYDHRLIDGRDAVQFLVHVKQSVEKPESMLLEI